MPEPPGWYILCRGRELRTKPVAVRIGERRLVVFRDGRGRPGVVDDRCAHRGMPLSAGSVQGDHLRCPYHGWEYGRDGSVCLVPAMQHCPQAWADLKIAALDCVEQDGFVWGRSGSVAAPAPHRLLHFRESGWTSFAMRTRFRASVDACLENFLDCPHATFVHEHWFRARTAKRVSCVVRSLADGAQAEYFDEPREKSAIWWLLAPRSGTMRHVDRFIAPNTSEVEYEFPNGLHYVITSSCTPLSRDETMVHTVITFRYRRLGPLVRLYFEPLSRLIIHQDARTLARRQDNLAAGGGAGFASTPADLLGPHIHAWRKALLSNTTPPAAGAEAHVEITI